MASSRGKNYTCELKHLCHSVLHISQDPCVGVGQRATAFWDRVSDHYEKNKPKGCEFRGRKSLEGKWSEVRHDVAKFSGCYQQVEDLQVSGSNLEDTVIKAKELYKQNNPKGKSFMFEDCWGILKDFPRFGGPADEMAKGRKRPSLSNVDKENVVPNQADAEGSSVADMVDLTESDDEQCKKRLVGTKKGKDQAKRQKSQEDALKMSAYAQKEMAAVGRDKVKVMQDTSLMQLLSMPTDSMEPEVRSFMLEWKLDEAKKLRQRMQSYSAQSTPVQPPIVPPPIVIVENCQQAATGPTTARRTPLELFNDGEIEPEPTTGNDCPPFSEGDLGTFGDDSAGQSML